MAKDRGSFNGKVVLITGGSSGIGLALAIRLAQGGARLWLAARRPEPLAQAAEQVRALSGAPCRVLPADVSDPGQAFRLVEQVTRQDGTPDLLINAAGITHPGYVHELDLEVFRRMMEVNYFGTLNTVKAVLPGMMARRSGQIVNIISVAGFGGVFGYSAYGASKYAVRGFSDVLRSEMKAHGISVSVVFPADTDTPQLAYEKPFQPAETKIMNAKAKTRSADEVAGIILEGVRRKRYVILPGGDTALLYHLNDLLGNARYLLVDWWVADARRKAGK